MGPSVYRKLETEMRAARLASTKAERTRLELSGLASSLAALRLDLAWLKLEHALRRKYRPDQPRVPAGQTGAGQWADGGGGGAGRNDPRVISDATPDNEWIPGAQYAQVTGERRYSVDLEEEAARGGHGKRDHVEKTREDLIKELDRDWKRWDTPRLQITEYRPAEGSFSSLMQANDLTNQTLRDNRNKVDAVATGQSEYAILEKRFGYVTGYEAYRDLPDSEARIRNTYGVRVLIDHDTRSERGYTVRTAFPINQYTQRK